MKQRHVGGLHRDMRAGVVEGDAEIPGRKGGRDVPTHMQVPIVFTLNEE